MGNETLFFEKQYSRQLSVIGSLIAVNLFYLTTTIGTQGISYQFSPFQRRAKWIAWYQINTCSIRTYSPLKEYGGWGYRNYPENSAYTVSGVVGIQLMLHAGEFILIGATASAQAQAALKSLYDVAK